MTSTHDSRSPSPISPSPSLSSSSIPESHSASSEIIDGLGPSVSRPCSPTSHADAGNRAELIPETDVVTCLWEDCGIVFTHLPTLIHHIHNDHIGVHKSNYTCEWATCQRRSLAQTSRFALISHIRSHTGEKPFTCPRPECDKSFTRSDALAKHMRLQHNISPPLPGRGGNRKRKRDEHEADSAPAGPALLHHNSNTPGASGFSTFKVEPSTPSDFPDEHNGTALDYFPPMNGHSHMNGHTNGAHRSRSHSPASSASNSDTDSLPPHLLQCMDPQTGLIMGRSPIMVRYLLMKAKHRYALEQHEQLIEELRVSRAELRKEKEEKEGALDQVLRASFGAQADAFIAPIPMASGHHTSRHRTPGQGEVPALFT